MIISLFCFIYYILIKGVTWIQKTFSSNVLSELIGLLLLGIYSTMGIGLLLIVGIVVAVLQVLLGIKVDLNDNKWVQKTWELVDEEDLDESDEDEEEFIFDEEESK